MKYTLTTFIILAISLNAFAQGAKISDAGGTPDPSAGLEVDFTDKGFLLPRMTETERNTITSPAEGLQIYNTTSQCLQIYVGGWRDVFCKCPVLPSSAFNNPGSGNAGDPVNFSTSVAGAGITYSWTFQSGTPPTSTTQNPAVTWSSAGTYNVALTVTDAGGCSSTTPGTVIITAIPASSPTLTCQAGWDITAGPNTGDKGCVTFTYSGSAVTYTTVRAADGNEWLQQDLGSNRVGTSYNDAQAYGDIFQWGRWNDGHEDRSTGSSNSVPSPNNPAGISFAGPGVPYMGSSNSQRWWNGGGTSSEWTGAAAGDKSSTVGLDPCKLSLGGSWRLPTGGSSGEWGAVMTAENITNLSSAFNSNLKLVAGGERAPHNSVIQNLGTWGRYWSSSPRTNSEGVAVYFYSSGASADGSGHRAAQRCLRCLRP